MLSPDEEHRKLFPEVPIVGFKNGKSLKNILVRAKVPQNKEVEGGCQGCGSKRCGVCQFINKTNTFEDSSGILYSIKDNLNCNSKMSIYLVQCKICKKQYVGSASTKFRLRFNNYKCNYRKHFCGENVPQALFFSHFTSAGHGGMDDWAFTLIEQSDNIEALRRRESHWQFKLNTFSPKGLNEREVYTDFG